MNNCKFCKDRPGGCLSCMGSKKETAPPMPRLSEDLPYEKHPRICQACGVPDETNGATDVTRCVEHDDHDNAEDIIVVLCKPCYKKLIKLHARLYSYLAQHEPHTGSMPICVECTHREGTACRHADTKANGGPGLQLKFPQPASAHVRYSGRIDGRRGGFMNVFMGPVHECAGRESIQPEGD